MRKTSTTYAQYKRNVFAHILSESFVKIHSKALDLKENELLYENVSKVAREFVTTTLKLNENTVEQIKDSLKNSSYFVGRIVTLAESMACEKMETLSKEKLPVPDCVELNDEEKQMIENLFKYECPEEGVTEITDSVAKAMMKENQKATEIKEALDLMKVNGTDQKTLQESVNKISQREPYSLMNSIILNISESYVKEHLTNNPNLKAADILKENATNIKEDSMTAYALYETLNVFGFKTFDKKMVEDLSYKIYRGEIN